MKLRPITIGEVEFLAYRLAKELMEWDEPIPDFRTRFPGKLESCLNGNKRIAVTTLLTFLFFNNKWLEVTNDQLYQFAVWVAESQPELKEGVALAIKEFIEKNIKNLK